MAIEIRPFLPEDVSQVQAFNQRLAQRGIDFQFPEAPESSWLPRRDAIPLYQEHFVAVEQTAVRGGYILKPQAFAVRGEVRMITNIQLPLSEGIVDARYRMLGLQLVKDAMARQPFLFGLGMGGPDQPFPRLLKVLKWRHVCCPFYFRVAHPFRFLREIVYIRRTRSRRFLLDTLAFSGLGWLAVKALHGRKHWQDGPQSGAVTCQLVPEFSSWADAIWQRSQSAYTLIAVRNAIILDTLYPAQNKRFLRLQVLRQGEPIGWAVLLDTDLSHHKQFGNMRLGSVVDCLALPGCERAVLGAATDLLLARGVDLIITNQLHHTWTEALDRAGFFSGPSNFAFFVSPALASLLDPFEAMADQIHMTRGDGDGPIHL
jgi:hypothetical protein